MIVVSKSSWVSSTCCYNNLHSSRKAFHKILDPGCRDLLPFSHRSINEVRH